MASMVPGKSLQCLNGVRGPLDGPSLAPGGPGGMVRANLLGAVARRTRQNLKAGSRLRVIVSTRAVGSGSRGAIIG
jgi:hypothetical protein